MRSISALSFVFALFFCLAFALEVTPGSSCAVLCLDDPESNPNDPNSSTTTPDDIVCANDDYNTVPNGIKYQNCLECLQTSNATSENESDNSWFIHNVRYAVDVCLYDSPKATNSKSISSPCDTSFACQPLQKALETGIANSTSGTYDYCSADGNAFDGSNLDACVQCLQSSPDQAYLANFVTALKAGCEQQPAPGALLGLSGTLFTNDLVNITSPPASLPSGQNGGSSSFTAGAIAGIAIGASLLFLGGTGLFYIYYRKQKRLYADPNLPPYTPWNMGGSMEPKIAMSRHYELRAQPGMYGPDGHLAKETQPIQSSGAFNPELSESAPSSVLPTHPAYIPSAHSRQASGDSERPVKSNRPDSYAVQTYMNAGHGANAMGMVIPPPPLATLHGPTFHNLPTEIVCDLYNMHGSAAQTRANSVEGRGPSLDRQPLFNSNLYQNSPFQHMQYVPANHQQPTYPNQRFNLPPPPPSKTTSTMTTTTTAVRTIKVPYLSFPSLPKLRVPKKYTPPLITVQVATPTEGVAPSTHVPSTHGHIPIWNQTSPPPHGVEARQIEEHVEASPIEPPVEDRPAYERSFEARRKQPPPPLIIPPNDGSQSRHWAAVEN